MRRLQTVQSIQAAKNYLLQGYRVGIVDEWHNTTPLLAVFKHP